MGKKTKAEVLEMGRSAAARVKAEAAKSGMSTLVSLAKVDWLLLKLAINRRCLAEVLRLCGEPRYIVEFAEPQRGIIGTTWTLADCVYFVDNVEYRGQVGVPTVQVWRKEFALVVAALSDKTELGVPWLKLIHQHRWPNVPYSAPELTSKILGRDDVLARVEKFKASILETCSHSGMPPAVVFAAAHWHYFAAALKGRMLAQVLNLLGEQHQAEFPVPQNQEIRKWSLEHFKYFVDNVAYDDRIGIEDSYTWLHRFEVVSRVASDLEEGGITYLKSIRFHRWPSQLHGPVSSTLRTIPPQARTREYFQSVMKLMVERYDSWLEFSACENKLWKQIVVAGFGPEFLDCFVNPNESRVKEWLYRQVAEKKTYRNFSEVHVQGVPGLHYFYPSCVTERVAKRLANEKAIPLQEAEKLVDVSDRKYDFVNVVRVACLMLGVVENPLRMRDAMADGYDASRDDTVRVFGIEHFALLLRLLQLRSYEEVLDKFPTLAEAIKLKRLRRALFVESARELVAVDSPLSVSDSPQKTDSDQ